MRGALPEVVNPFPLASFLPGVLQEDELLCRLTAGLDDVLSSVIATLDCLDAYLDPDLAPPDFLDWLGGWVGVDLAADWPADRKRVVVTRAVELHRRRGTVAGLRDLLTALTGVPVSVVDSGGVSWSTAPTEDGETGEVWVRVVAPGADRAVVDAVVASAKPAHVPHTTEV